MKHINITLIANTLFYLHLTLSPLPALIMNGNTLAKYRHNFLLLCLLQNRHPLPPLFQFYSASSFTAFIVSGRNAARTGWRSGRLHQSTVPTPQTLHLHLYLHLHLHLHLHVVRLSPFKQDSSQVIKIQPFVHSLSLPHSLSLSLTFIISKTPQQTSLPDIISPKHNQTKKQSSLSPFSSSTSLPFYSKTPKTRNHKNPPTNNQPRKKNAILQNPPRPLLPPSSSLHHHDLATRKPLFSFLSGFILFLPVRDCCSRIEWRDRLQEHTCYPFLPMPRRGRVGSYCPNYKLL